MQTAPAVSTPLGASWVYRSIALLITIILIAACALFTLASGSFSAKNGLLCALTTAASAWLLHDAFRPVRGALHFAAGQWVLAQGDIEYAGTIAPRIDLQSYVLVYFVAFETNHKQPDGTSTRPQSIWLHLERKHMRNMPDWLALRRAIFARTSTQTAASASVGTHGH